MNNKIFLLFVLIFSQEIFCEEYFVTNSLELKNAIQNAIPGDVIILKNGTWQDIQIEFKNNGTSLLPIILKAETSGKVLLTGKSNLRIAGNYLIVDGLFFKDGYSTSGVAVVEFKSSAGVESNFCRLTNTSIVDYNPTDSKLDYKWISLYGTHNRVDHCYLKGKTNIGTTLVVWLSNKPNYHLIDSNYFAFRPPYPENGAETIRVGTSDWSMYDSFTTVEYNYFEECNGETEIISNKSCNNVYRYNTFKNCQGTLTLRHGNNCTVEGNYFFCGKKTDSGGIRIIGEDHKVINNYIEDSYGTSFKSAITLMNGVPNSPLNRYFQVKRALVAHNTIVNAKVSINIGAGKDSELTLPPIDCTIANNIFYSAYSPIVTLTDQPINMHWTSNIFYGGNIGMSISSENYFQNPELIKSIDGLYRLSPNSFAIDRGTSLSTTILYDFDGQKRNEKPDIGADEFSLEEIKIKPVSSKDVGPEYLRTTSIQEKKMTNLPSEIELHQNYPNPFNPKTLIKFSIPSSFGFQELQLSVYNLLGIELIKLFEGKKSPGIYEIQFDAKNLSSGIYFCKLQIGNNVKVIKMVLMK